MATFKVGDRVHAGGSLVFDVMAVDVIGSIAIGRNGLLFGIKQQEECTPAPRQHTIGGLVWEETAEHTAWHLWKRSGIEPGYVSSCSGEAADRWKAWQEDTHLNSPVTSLRFVGEAKSDKSRGD